MLDLNVLTNFLVFFLVKTGGVYFFSATWKCVGTHQGSSVPMGWEKGAHPSFLVIKCFQRFPLQLILRGSAAQFIYLKQKF